MFFKLTRIMALTIACFLASEAAVAGPEEPFLKTAEIVYAQANATEGDLRLRSLRKVREILDCIVADYPASDLAVKILLKETVNGIDVAALDAELAAAAAAVPEPERVPETALAVAPSVPDATAVDPFADEEPEPAATEPPAPEIARVLSLTTEETEKALQLDRQAVRDIQARLLVLGHDPNGIDGMIGNGTRGAIWSWQASVAVPPTGFLDAGQLDALKAASEPDLAQWLRSEKNARMYEPPQPIALTPSRPSPDAELAGYPLPESVTGAIGIVARAACGDETGACVDEVTLALAEYIFRWAFDGERLAQVEQLKWLFANPGRFDDTLARIGAFDAALTDTAFREEFVDRVNGRVLGDIGRDVARDFAMSLVTGVVSEALSRHYDATGQAEAAAFTRRWFEPMVEIGLVIEGAGAATPASLAAGTVYIWASNAYAFWHLGESQYRAEEAGATREEQLTRLAAEIDSYSRTLVSGRLTGSAFPDNQGEPLTERHAEILRSVLEQHLELQRWWLESGDAALLETFDPVLSFARDFYETMTTEQPLDAADGTGALPPDLVPAPAPSGSAGQGSVVFGLPVTPESIRAAVDRYRASFAELCALPSVRESGLTCPGVVGACKGEGCIGRGPFRARETIELLEAPGSTNVVARLRPGDWVFSEHSETWYVPCRTVRQAESSGQSPGLPPVGTVRWRKNYLGEGISVYHSPTGDQQYFDPDFREVPDAPSQAMDPCHHDNQPTWYLVTTASGQMGWVDTANGEFDGMGHFSGDDMTAAPMWTLDRVEIGENLYGLDNLYDRVATPAEVDSGPPDHWAISTEPRLTLSRHEVVPEKLALASDNSVSVFGAPYLPAITPSYAPDYRTELHLYPSPDGRASIVLQREASSGWGSRAILLNDDTRTAYGRDLIPRSQTQGVDNARDVIFVDGPVAWSPHSRYAILRYTSSEHEFRALLFDRETGRSAVMQPPEMPNGTWADVQIDSLRAAGGGVHEITFRTFRCTNANCEDFTRTADYVYRFQLESGGPGILPSRPPSATDTIAQLTDGLYGRSPESCGLELPEEGGNWGFHLRQLRMPEYYLGDAVTCTVRGAEYRGDQIEIDAACTAEGMSESRTHHWTILSPTSFRDHGAPGGPTDYTLCEAAPSEPQRQKWTEAIVHPGGYGRPELTSCIWQSPSAGVDCLRADGASEETLRFARARAMEGGEGPVVPIAFQELGQVDIAVLDALTMNGNEIDYFVNTAPETIAYPMYPETDLAVLTSRGDRRARAILAQYPGAMHWRSFVGGMRVLPNGHQRFSTVIYWTENCRACPIVGYNLATVDFDQTGRLRAFEARGIFDNRRYGRLMSLSASDLQRDSAAIQFQLNLRGYDAGPMDGVMGPRSRAALAEFQREHGINSGTGQPDTPTLVALANRETMFSNGTAAQPQSFGVSDLTGTWTGNSTVGSTVLDYRWQVQQSGASVSGTIELKRQTAESWSRYRFVGSFSGNTIRFRGTEWETSSNGSFCMASGELTLTTVGTTARLDGTWGGNAIAGGCPTNAQGRVQLERAISEPQPASGSVESRFTVIVLDEPLDWWEASAIAAEELGGSLATINSQSEQEEVWRAVQARPDSWVRNSAGYVIGPWLGGFQPSGAQEPNGGWQWVDGTSFTYQNWITSREQGGEQPNNSAGVEDALVFMGLGSISPGWNDYPSRPTGVGWQAQIRAFVLERNGASSSSEIGDSQSMSECRIGGPVLNAGDIVEGLTSRTLRGRTASGSDWSLWLNDERPSNVAVARFTNAAGETAIGRWHLGWTAFNTTAICQSYNGGASHVCHDVLPCANDPGATFAMRNEAGEFSSVMTTRDRITLSLPGASGEPSTTPAATGTDIAGTLRTAISSCWNTGGVAPGVHVVVAFDLTPDGRPVSESLTLAESGGGTEAEVRDAFEAARRAILRCGAGGYALPPDDYETWRSVRARFGTDAAISFTENTDPVTPETDFTVSRDGAGIHFHFPRNEIRRLLANLSNGDLASTDFSVTVGESTMVACTHFQTQGASPANYGYLTLEALQPVLQCSVWSRDGTDSFGIMPGSAVSIDVSGYPIDPVVMTLETTPLIEGIMTEGQSCDFRIGNNLGQYSYTRTIPCGLPPAPDPNAEFYQLYAESDGPAFAARLIERSRWRNSPEQRDHLGRMLLEMISSDPDSDSTGDLSRMAAIMHDIAVDAGGDGEMVRIMNYARNSHQGDHPSRAAVLTPGSGWNGPVPDGEKEFHVIGIANRADVEKYTHPDGREAVFLRDGSGNWQVMRDGTNDATFNLVPNSNRNPESIYQHMILDVIPWMLHGVSPADSTSLRDRIAAFERSGMLSTVRTLYGPVADITDAIESVPPETLATGPLTALNNRPESPGSPEGNADLTSAVGALDAAETVTDVLRAAWEVFRLARSYESYALLRADWTAAASQVSDAGRLVTTQALQSVGTAGVTIVAELILKDVMVEKLMRCPCRLNGETFTDGQANSLVDSFFNLVTADLPGQIIDQSLNIARAAIDVRQTNDGYVDAVKGAARTTLSRYESGEITGDQFAQAIAYSRSLNDDFRDQRTFLALNLVPANRGEIVLQLAEIKVAEGPLGLSTLALGDFLDQLRRFGLSDLGAQSFAEEIANEFGLQSWPVR